MSTLKTKVNLGDLKKVVNLQRVTSIADEYGIQEDTWETFAVVRCKVEFDDRLMREIFRDDGVNSTIAKIFTFRYVPGVTTRDRLVADGDIYEIYGINNVDEESRFLKVWARMIC